MLKKNGVLVLLYLAMLLPAAFTPHAAAQGVAQLRVLVADDCGKCHDRQPAEIAAKGAAHKTAINCRDCHVNHRPAVASNIPQCSMCHSGGNHYQLKACMSCHNPHQPLEVTLKGELRGACLTCHEGVGKELDSQPSKHTKLACNTCHAEKHAVIPDCVNCHKPHSPQVKQADCKACHQAHQPKTLTYGPQTPSVLCAACHSSAFNLLTASKTKHREVACVACHQTKHKTVPQCADCHGSPHPETMHQRFPKCGSCHNIAHDLNNWPEKKEEKAGGVKSTAPVKNAAPVKDAAKKEPAVKR